MKNKRPRPPFVCSLSKKEFILGLCFLPVYVLVLPVLIGMLREYWPTPVSDTKITTVCCLIGFLFVLICLYRALRTDWDRLCDNKLAIVLTLVGTHLLNMVMSMVVVLVSIAFLEDGANPYETETVKSSGGQMFAALVLLSPIAEEVLFRGVLFGAIRKKSRLAAYLVTVVLYVLIGVWQYTGSGSDTAFLFNALQGVPAAFALCWCYERTGCLWAPILYHALSNLGTGIVL